MKNIILLFCVIALSSCLKENHSVRLKNYLSRPIENIRVGDASLGTVDPAAVSSYYPIHSGDFYVSSNSYVIGNGKISGKGTHKWTIYVSVSGALSIAED